MKKTVKVMYQKIIIDGECWKWDPVDEALVREKADERTKNKDMDKGKETYNTLMQVAQYAPVTRAWFGPLFYLLISKPEDTEILLNKYLDKSVFYAKYLGDTLKNALPVAPFGSATYITYTYLSYYMFLEALGDVCPGSLQNITKFVSSGMRYEETVKLRFFKPHLNLNYFWNRSSLRKEQLEICQVLEDFIKEIIDKKQSNAVSTSSNRQYLNYLLEMNEQNKISMSGVIEESVFMFHAGSETIAVTIGSALILLGIHPEIQEKVYEEISSLLSDDTQSVTLEDVNKMYYLERVVKETLRLLPPVPFIVRKVDTEMQFDSYFVPAGCDIVIPVSQLHRLPDIWPNPLMFNPDRFLPEEVEKRPRGAFIPFSSGPRNCIGWKYAMLSMKVFLAIILKRFRVAESLDYKKVEDIDLDMCIVATAKKGYRVRLEERN
ncbi:cytochrome P450 4C1-like [Zophobas morio]|uniref:cytochrome P450 4C1-like n=1 Tax=Zophobas morio TaxID=2755281 RepID=UPI0030836B22